MTHADAPERRESRAAGLDLVRSLAILMVLMAHGGGAIAFWYEVTAPVWIVGWGFFGVELFFVLSGFLIGRLLLRIIQRKPTIRAWLVFLTRRWIRTLPLYFLCLIVLAVVWPPKFWEPDQQELARVLPWFATLTQNLAWPMVSPWFGATWSLTIEEWFYLLFATLLLTGVARFGRRWFWISVIVFLIGPLLLRLGMPAGGPWDEVTRKVVFYRLDAIAFGVAAAGAEAVGWLPKSRHAPLLAIGLALETVCVGLAFFDTGLTPLSHGPIADTVMFDLVSFGFVLMLPTAAAAIRPFPLIGVLARRVSEQSYCIYLIHLPLLEAFSFYRRPLGLSATVCLILAPIVIWVLSWASYRWLERPLLALRPSQDTG